MKGEGRFRWALRLASHFFSFFLLVAFVITCCMTLFLSVFSQRLGIVLTGESLADAAKLTFLNVVLITLLLTVADTLRRHYTVERPVRHIAAALEKMVQGDFSVRVRPVAKWAADDRFNEIIASVNKMAEELAGVETLRTDFVASVSHEMKTPLAVMQNYARLLQSADLTEEKRLEYATAVGDGCRRLSDMMTNVLRLNRLENQQIYEKKETYDLGEQLCDALLQYEREWERRGIEPVTDLAEGVTVCADRELLSLVWNNLLSNAFKFTPDGGRVLVSLRAEGGYATVRVQDTGCGMTAEVGAHIFEKFYQGDRSRATQGNGLGLALVKRVVDILQGEIGVESTPGKGSTFTVRIKRGLYGLEEDL